MDLYILSIFRCWDLHISFWQCSLLVYLDLLSLFYRLFLLYRCYETPLISVLPLSHRLLSPFYGLSSDIARKGKPFGALPVQRLLGSTLTFPFPFDYLSFHPTLACPRGQCCLAMPSKDFPLFVELLTRKTYIKALPIGLEGHPNTPPSLRITKLASNTKNSSRFSLSSRFSFTLTPLVIPPGYYHAFEYQTRPTLARFPIQKPFPRTSLRLVIDSSRFPRTRPYSSEYVHRTSTWETHPSRQP
jgi:hypothetical protein